MLQAALVPKTLIHRDGLPISRHVHRGPQTQPNAMLTSGWIQCRIFQIQMLPCWCLYFEYWLLWMGNLLWHSNQKFVNTDNFWSLLPIPVAHNICDMYSNIIVLFYFPYPILKFSCTENDILRQKTANLEVLSYSFASKCLFNIHAINLQAV